MTITSELALRDDDAPAVRLPVLPELPDVDSWIRAMASIAKLAAQICNTSFVPKGLRGDEAAVTAAILTGRELGLPPMAALRHIHVVEGVPSLDAEYKRAKVQSLGHEFDIIKWEHDECVVSGRRKGSRKPPLLVSYTIADARRAELVKSGGNYIKRPKVMMLARATTLMCSALFSDVTNGLATTELLESGDPDAIADAIGSSLDMPAIDAAPRVDAGQARARKHAAATPEPSPAAPGNAGPAPVAPPSAEAAAAGDAPITEATWTEISGKLAAIGVEERNRPRIAGQIARKPVKDATEADGRKVADTLDGLTAEGLAALLDDIKIGDDPRGETDE